MTRSVGTIAAARRNTIELREQSAVEPLPAVSDLVLLSRATRVVDVGTDGADGARLIGVSIEPDSRALVSVTGRRHWWSGRTTIAANQLDCSIPGELRSTKSRDTRAA